MQQITSQKKNGKINTTWLDRAISYLSPERGANRMKAKMFMAVTGQFVGARRDRRQTSGWTTRLGDADSDILPDLDMLRQRSRDLSVNAPIAAGALKTVRTHVVGTGLRLESRINREKLQMAEDEASEWQANTELEFDVWARSLDCSVSRTMNFYDMQAVSILSALESGDIFVLFPRKKIQTSPYSLKLQLIEADRISNKDNAIDSELLAGGIEKEKDGTPKNYHILTRHPGDRLNPFKTEWQIVPAFTGSGRKNIIHLMSHARPGQSRGIPYLAPAIEPLRQLEKYSEAELMAAVVSAMFTVFIKTKSGESDLSVMQPSSEIGGKIDDKDYKLGSGAMLSLAQDEDIAIANPNRPNVSFDPFVQAILRQVGVALELPFELLIKHFTASYSAARSALLEAWKFFLERRQWLATHFCDQVYEAWMEEAILLGRINAPGFFTDAAIRHAYLSNMWIGPAPGQINPKDEAAAAEKRINLGISTVAEETASITGQDWDKKVNQIRKERKILGEIGIGALNQGAQGEPAQGDENEIARNNV